MKRKIMGIGTIAIVLLIYFSISPVLGTKTNLDIRVTENGDIWDIQPVDFDGNSFR